MTVSTLSVNTNQWNPTVCLPPRSRCLLFYLYNGLSALLVSSWTNNELLDGTVTLPITKCLRPVMSSPWLTSIIVPALSLISLFPCVMVRICSPASTVCRAPVAQLTKTHALLKYPNIETVPIIACRANKHTDTDPITRTDTETSIQTHSHKHSDLHKNTSKHTQSGRKDSQTST